MGGNLLYSFGVAALLYGKGSRLITGRTTGLWLQGLQTSIKNFSRGPNARIRWKHWMVREWVGHKPTQDRLRDRRGRRGTEKH